LQKEIWFGKRYCRSGLTKYSAFGKWSPNWEDPFRVVRCTPDNAYILKTLLGEEFTTAINERYLKYYPSIEIDR
jgi:hypothetical protein